jgi:hypothetical protein
MKRKHSVGIEFVLTRKHRVKRVDVWCDCRHGDEETPLTALDWWAIMEHCFDRLGHTDAGCYNAGLETGRRVGRENVMRELEDLGLLEALEEAREKSVRLEV